MLIIGEFSMEYACYQKTQAEQPDSYYYIAG